MPKKTDEGVAKKTGESSTPMKKSGDTVTSKKTGESATGRATCAWGCGLLRADTTVSRHAKVCPIKNRYVCRHCSQRFASVDHATTHAKAEHAWMEGDGIPYHHDLRSTRDVLDDVSWAPPPLTPRVHFDKEAVVSVARDPNLESLVITPGRDHSRIVVPTKGSTPGATQDSELHLEVLLLRAKLDAQAQQLDAQARQIHEQNLQLAHHRDMESRLLRMIREPPLMVDQSTQTGEVKLVAAVNQGRTEGMEMERALSLETSDLESITEEQSSVKSASLGQPITDMKKPSAVPPLMDISVSGQRHQRSGDERSRSDRGERSPISRRHCSRERSRSPARSYKRHASRGRMRSRSPAGNRDNRHSSRYTTARHTGQRGQDSLEMEAELQTQISELKRRLEEAKSKYRR